MIVFLLLATTFMTLSKSFSKKTKLSYQDLKYRKMFLKLRKFNKRSKMLLIFRKMIVIVDYGISNIGAVKNALDFLKIKSILLEK